MTTTTNRRILYSLLFMASISTASAQVGIGTDNPHSSTVLDITSSDKGVLIPRMDSASRLAISAPADGLLVYDTDTASFWFYDSSAWQNLSSGGGAHPWYLQGSTPPAPATSNSSNVYVMGSVAVGKNKVIPGVMLDVSGPVRGGNPSTGAIVGSNSVAFGINTASSGIQSSAFGNRSVSSGNNTFSVGNSGEARGHKSAAFGERNLASGERSIVFGNLNKATGENSSAFGEWTETTLKNSAVFGTYNIIDSNFLFTIGNGSSNSSRGNALTIRSNGWMGIGATTPTGSEKLKVNGSIVTAGGTYPDYVFEDYFNDFSELNPDYKFKTLAETKTFIEKNRHLPGILPVTALSRTAEGNYEFNLSELSVQSLEKIEELFLYVIEQDEKTGSLKEELNGLQATHEELTASNHTLEALIADMQLRLKVVEEKINKE